VVGQGVGDGGAAVAGEHADFEAAFGADELHEKGEELGLLGGQVHFAHTVLRGGLAQALPRWMRRRKVWATARRRCKR